MIVSIFVAIDPRPMTVAANESQEVAVDETSIALVGESYMSKTREWNVDHDGEQNGDSIGSSKNRSLYARK